MAEVSATRQLPRGTASYALVCRVHDRHSRPGYVNSVVVFHVLILLQSIAIVKTLRRCFFMAWLLQSIAFFSSLQESGQAMAWSMQCCQLSILHNACQLILSFCPDMIHPTFSFIDFLFSYLAHLWHALCIVGQYHM